MGFGVCVREKERERSWEGREREIEDGKTSVIISPQNICIHR